MIEWKGGPQGPWEPYYTRRPIKVKGRWYFFTTIYRREKNVAVYPHQGYEYGDQFDVLKDA